MPKNIPFSPIIEESCFLILCLHNITDFNSHAIVFERVLPRYSLAQLRTLFSPRNAEFQIPDSVHYFALLAGRSAPVVRQVTANVGYSDGRKTITFQCSDHRVLIYMYNRFITLFAKDSVTGYACSPNQGLRSRAITILLPPS